VAGNWSTFTGLSIGTLCHVSYSQYNMRHNSYNIQPVNATRLDLAALLDVPSLFIFVLRNAGCTFFFFYKGRVWWRFLWQPFASFWDIRWWLTGIITVNHEMINRGLCRFKRHCAKRKKKPHYISLLGITMTPVTSTMPKATSSGTWHTLL